MTTKLTELTMSCFTYFGSISKTSRVCGMDFKHEAVLGWGPDLLLGLERVKMVDPQKWLASFFIRFNRRKGLK